MRRQEGKGALAAVVEQPLGRQAGLELFQGQIQGPEAKGLHSGRDELELPAGFVQADASLDQHVHAVSRMFLESLERLGCERVVGLLVHNADNLLIPGGERLWDLLQALKAEQRLQRIGVSVCHPEQLARILDRYRIDLVQLPFNIYDQRFAQTGMLRDLKKLEVEVHGRSAFLQGLLLLPAEKLPGYFDSIREHQARLHRNVVESDRTPLASALIFCLSQPDIDHIIVGCETVAQLEEILDVAQRAAGNILDLRVFALNNDNILDPSRWMV